MSEEEIIKTVDNFLDGYRQYNVKTGETYIPYKYGEGQKFCYVEDFEAIQGLLDLYNKEKEKNKNLEKYDYRNIKLDKKDKIWSIHFTKEQLDLMNLGIALYVGIPKILADEEDEDTDI